MNFLNKTLIFFTLMIILTFFTLMITLTACNLFGEDPKIKGARLIKELDSQSTAIQIASQQMPGFPDHPDMTSETINVGGKAPGILISVIKKTEVSKIGENHYTVIFTLSWDNGVHNHVTKYDIDDLSLTKMSEEGDILPQYE